MSISRLLVVALVLIAVVGAVAFFRRGSALSSATASGNQLESYFAVLMTTNNPDAFLIVSAVPGREFLQFKANNGELEIDFPVFTARQQELESRFRNACAKAGLQVKEQPAQGGRFLDAYARGSHTELAKLVSGLLTDTFGTAPHQPVLVEWTGLTVKNGS
jgi:hypothetical protein